MEVLNILIQDNLIKLGITPANRGFHYLEKAVEILSRGQFTPMMKIYEEIALEFGTSVSRVERACRHAIQCGHDVYTEKFSEYFDDLMKFNKDRITISTFISVVLLHVKREVQATQELRELGIC